MELVQQFILSTNLYWNGLFKWRIIEVSPPPTNDNYLNTLTNLFQGSKEQFQTRLLDGCANVDFSRPLSWDFCYHHFQSQSEKYFLDTIPSETLARGTLELSNYLASFGMFRSAEMKKVNRCFFEPIIVHIFKVAQANGIHSFNAFKDINLQQLRSLIAGVEKAYSDAFESVGIHDQRPNDTMTSKILMGMFGVLPALDERYVYAVRKLHKQIRENQNLPTRKQFSDCLPTTLRDDGKLEFLLKISRNPRLETFLQDLVRPALQYSTPKVDADYPVMRLLDLYLWVSGQNA